MASDECRGIEHPGGLTAFAVECALNAAWATEFWRPTDPDYGFVDYSVVQALAVAIDLNPDYFVPDAVHEWSSIYGIETYLRIENATAERQLVADDGIIGDIAQFSSGEGSKGE